MKVARVVLVTLVVTIGTAFLGAWSHEGVDFCPGPRQRLPPGSTAEAATLLVDGIIDTAIRAASGYWPRDIAAAVHRRAHGSRSDAGYHQFAAYAMTKRLGPWVTRLLGGIKECSDVTADPFDLSNNEIGIRAAENGEPNPALR